MSIVKQIMLTASIYIVSAVIIEVLLWYFNPSLNEFLRSVITTSPVFISIVMTRIIVNRITMERD